MKRKRDIRPTNTCPLLWSFVHFTKGITMNFYWMYCKTLWDIYCLGKASIKRNESIYKAFYK